MAAVADDSDGVGAVTGDQSTVFVRQSASDTWFCIADDASAGGGTTYASGAAKADVDTLAECNAASW